MPWGVNGSRGALMFKNVLSYMNFAREVRGTSRFVRSQEAEDFLQAVSETMQARKATIPAGKTLCRAQLGHDIEMRPVDEDREIEEKIPFGAGRMRPLPDRASEGRVNPHGIPYLYLATDRETAIAEVRPWIGSHVSIGYFKTTREICIVDCSRHHHQSGFLHYLMNFQVDDVDKPPEPEVVQRVIWGDIDHEFSRPVTRADDTADYAPTQILAELFKQRGMDGIAYKSSLSEDGLNIALFSFDTTEMYAHQLFKVKKVKLCFAERSPVWQVKKK